MKTKFLVYIIAAFLVIALVCNVPRGNAGTYSVDFTTGDISLVVFSVRLDFEVSVQTTVPTIFCGGSGDVKIDVSPESASISVVFLGNTYTLDFTTPIGSVKIPIFNIFGLGMLYAKIAGSMKTVIGVEGAGTVSHASLSWTSEGTQAVSVCHTGSMFSSDSINLAIPISYVLSLAIGVEAFGATLYEYSHDLVTLYGTPVITESISPFPIAVVAIIAVVVVIVICGIVVAKRT